ncbi:GRAM domain-containing protein 1B-like isoform X2 [Orbicella faveolata]|uniref:GRAM domain-containing protein 1B-like isoform X2 n=1 Tax=Orbicella faveolata TaxID=48498 RepID=UPI0009E5BF6A|nr:GRAM domain-containing protein 1B-like isoform X2 [Orbicella faveolata]
MEDSLSSNASDTINSKGSETKKERPASLDLESSNLGKEEELNLDDTKPTTRKAKEFSSSQEDLLESPDDGDDSSVQRTSPRSKSITNSLRSKIRDLSPSRRSTPPSSATKTERKTSKGNKAASKSPKSPGNWLPASFNQIFSSYKTKCGDFKRLFKELPESEQLIVDYSCALQRDILVHGRLYISQNWLCFYANIFGWETFVTIQCTEISSIRKEKTALVIPNAVQVCTETEKYFFASFISRDTAYTVLFRIWQNALLDQPLSPSELIQVVGKYSEGKEGSSDNDDSDDDEKQGVFEDSGSEGDVEGELPSDSVSSRSQSSLGTELGPENQTVPDKDSENAPVVSVTPPSPGVLSPTGLENGQLLRPEVPVKCVCDTHLSKEIVNEEFPVSVDTLYEYLFTESDFYKRVQKGRRTKDLVLNPWETAEDGQRRTITYTVSLNHALGPKHSPTTEQQHCFQGSVPGKLYIIQAEVNNEGIPYGDSFYITNRYCMTRTSNTTSRLRVSSEVTYQKSVWGFVRNMIEKNALEGLEGYFQFLVESLRRETTEGQWSKKRKTSPTRRHKRTRSLKNKEVTEPDMEVSNEDKTGLLQRLSARGTISRLVGVRSYLPQVIVTNPLAVLVTILLGALLLLNVVLVYRLVLLEHATQTGIHWDGAIKDLPVDAQQWAQLLQQQKHVQEVEMRRWRDVLASSIQLMNQVQQSLDLLQEELGKEQTTAAAEAT